MNNTVKADFQTTLSEIWRADTQQRAFRKIMNVFARPGVVETLEGEALLLTLATLLDGATTFNDYDGLVSAQDFARLETVAVSAEQARIVLASGENVPAFLPSLGTLESPDMGATIVLKVNAIGMGDKLKLTGPGIAGVCNVSVNGLNPAWIDAHQDWNSSFPLGVDLLLVVNNQVMALPRTSKIERTA